jgi:hypothetical protein
MNAIDILTVMASVAGVIGLLFGFYTWRKDVSKKNRETQETKESKPALSLYFYDFEVSASDSLEIFVGIPREDYTSTVKVVCNIPFAVGNIGGSDLEDVNILYKYQPHSSLPIPNNILSMKPRPVTSTTVVRDFFKDGDQQCVSFLINKIQPRVKVIANDAINLGPSTIQWDMNITDKEGVDKVIRANAFILWFFDLIVTVKDQIPKRVRVNIRCVETDNINELEKESMERIIQDYKNQPEEKANIFPEEYIVFQPDYKIVFTEPSGKVYEASVNPDNIGRLRIHGNHFLSERIDRTKDETVIF